MLPEYSSAQCCLAHSRSRRCARTRFWGRVHLDSTGLTEDVQLLNLPCLLGQPPHATGDGVATCGHGHDRDSLSSTGLSRCEPADDAFSDGSSRPVTDRALVHPSSSADSEPDECKLRG